jgi:hypothetical protein
MQRGRGDVHQHGVVAQVGGGDHERAPLGVAVAAVPALIQVPVVGRHEHKPILFGVRRARRHSIEKLPEPPVHGREPVGVLGRHRAPQMTRHVDRAQVHKSRVRVPVAQPLHRRRGHPGVLDRVAVLLAIADQQRVDFGSEHPTLDQRRPVDHSQRGQLRPSSLQDGEKVGERVEPRAGERVVEHTVLARPHSAGNRGPAGSRYRLGARAHVQQARHESPGSYQRPQPGRCNRSDAVPAQPVDPDHQHLRRPLRHAPLSHRRREGCPGVCGSNGVSGLTHLAVGAGWERCRDDRDTA